MGIVGRLHLYLYTLSIFTTSLTSIDYLHSDMTDYGNATILRVLLGDYIYIFIHLKSIHYIIHKY